MNPLIPGLGLIGLASIAGGLFAVPLRRRRRYAVENLWLPAFLIGYLLIPHLAVQLLLPGWTTAVRHAGAGVLAPAFLCGLGWGLASVLFTQAVARIGLSLGYAVIMGLITIFGAGIPLLRHWSAISGAGCVWICAGLAAAMAGVALCGRAGILRERRTQGTGSAPSGARIRTAVLLCLGAGLFSACSNLGFDHAAPLARSEAVSSAGPFSGMICWLPIYWGGCVMTVAISAVRLSANGGWRLYAGPGARHDFRLMLATGFLLALTQIPYGIGAYYLGPLGTSVGFAVNMVLSLMAANFVGILSGEWKGATPGIVKTLSAGLTLLLLAVVLLAAGNNS